MNFVGDTLMRPTEGSYSLVAPFMLLCSSPVLLVVLLLVALYIISLNLFNFWVRYPGEPPLYRSFLPWVGYGAALNNDSTEVLQKLSSETGGVFVIPMAGRRTVWLTDPSCLKSVNRLEQLSFDPITHMVRSRAQGLAYDDFDKIDPKIRRSIEVTHLSGEPLKTLTIAAVRAFDNMPNVRKVIECPQCSEPLFSPDYATVELYELCRSLQFDVLCGCLLGKPLPGCFKAYKTCRSLFELVLIGLPGSRYLFRPYFDSMRFMRAAILKVAEEHFHPSDRPVEDVAPSTRGGTPREEHQETPIVFSAAFHHRQAYHQKVQVKDSLFVGVFDALFTGINMSAPTTFWLVARLLHDRALLKEVVDEIHQVLSPDRTFRDLTLDDINKMEILEATQKSGGCTWWCII
eukprot:GHVS01077638.1.p1 GENE.GHVS01077638.1~~GHVS01077638.1.p1  ORF type:complete len:403 (-),score=42.84 GHVS01077638.1:1622-2830(-)